MKQTLSKKEYLFLASMLFGLFFGAGNLIFPVYMGQQAGAHVWSAALGFCTTGVGLTLLGVVAMGLSKSDNLLELACHVNKGFGYFFTILLYLSIGPLFAIPRTATVSFSVGINPLISANEKVVLAIFSAAFFLIVLYFSLKPSGILTWVGKVLNPVFLVFLGILTITALINPMGEITSLKPVENYMAHGFFQGFLDGYHTMDALASLAFGVVLIHVVRDLKVTESKAITKITIKSGILSSILMAAIYCMLALVGAQSRNILGINADGGVALHEIAVHYFGMFGAALLGITITVACLKTSIGLITSCATTFSEMSKNKVSYRTLVIVLCSFSFFIANMGLSQIIKLSVPVLMFLYPMTIVLIALCIIGNVFHYNKVVFNAAIIPTAITAMVNFIDALPTEIRKFFSPVLSASERILPFYSIGMGWCVPAVAGLVIGLILYKIREK